MGLFYLAQGMFAGRGLVHFVNGGFEDFHKDLTGHSVVIDHQRFHLL